MKSELISELFLTSLNKKEASVGYCECCEALKMEHFSWDSLGKYKHQQKICCTFFISKGKTKELPSYLINKFFSYLNGCSYNTKEINAYQ